jgi:nucleotide-binding universal stress UspA family protein
MANIKHILVATDLSDRSERACERGIRLARERAATVDLLHVVEGGLRARSKNAGARWRRSTCATGS